MCLKHDVGLHMGRTDEKKEADFLLPLFLKN